jgi:teichuronic acid biosynthesis glycosyltransferase TuaC
VIQKFIYENDRDFIIPCGIDLEIFQSIDMKIAREELSFMPDKKYILFSSGFDNQVKNSPLAFSAVEKIELKCELIELKNKSREEVNLLLNACDLLLLTSFSEGSPQIIKEAMACNCPIVATDVGDIKEVIGKTDGCFITSFEPEDVAEKIGIALKFDKRTYGREKIKNFNNKLVAEKVYSVYKKVVEA